jgi:two-component system, cell cycle response regulator
VLRKVAETIQASVRTADTLGRYRTNEFMVLMPETTAQEATLASMRILGQIETGIFTAPGQTDHYPVTLRIGISCLQDGIATPEALLTEVHSQTADATEAQPVKLRVLSRS